MSASWSVAPYFVVRDVVLAANFYRDKLGFHYERFWGDPPAFCMVKRGGISRGVKLERDPCDQEYGCRDFEVLDLDGYRLCFGQDLEG